MAGRVGVFGGTFDPPHLGHLIVIQSVLEQLALDRMLLIPAGYPPHKESAPVSDAELRARMVEAAMGGHPGLEMRDLELRRLGPSFTVQTLEVLKAEAPNDALYLVMGFDQWRSFPGWRSPERIQELATVVVMNRGGEGEQDVPGPDLEGRVVHVRVPAIELSSTEIRERVRTGRSIRFLVPDEVRRIIQKAKLYL
jgi:nicotinate-nucleotide adenylyltransferase